MPSGLRPDPSTETSGARTPGADAAAAADGAAPTAESAGGSAEDVVFETAHLVDLVWGKIIGWVEGMVAMLPNLAVAVLVLILFAILARFAARFVRAGLGRAHANQQLIGLVSATARYAMLGLGLFVALDVLSLEKAVTSLLAGVGVVGLALGFAFQDIASNFMSGAIMALRRPFAIGDLVETGDSMGFVEDVSLRATTLRNFAGQRVIIPNKDVLQSAIVNYTQSGRRRVEVPVGVAYGSDLEEVRRVALEAVEDFPTRASDEEADVIFTGFGGSSIDLEVRVWLDLSADAPSYVVARSELIERVEKAFRAAEIEIPFPIRTIDLPEGFEIPAEMREAS